MIKLSSIALTSQQRKYEENFDRVMSKYFTREYVNILPENKLRIRFNLFTIFQKLSNVDLVTDETNLVARYYKYTAIVLSLVYIPNIEKAIEGVLSESSTVNRDMLKELALQYDLEQFEDKNFLSRLPLSKKRIYNDILLLFVYSLHNNNDYLLDLLLKRANPYLYKQVKKSNTFTNPYEIAKKDTSIVQPLAQLEKYSLVFAYTYFLQMRTLSDIKAVAKLLVDFIDELWEELLWDAGNGVLYKTVLNNPDPSIVYPNEDTNVVEFVNELPLESKLSLVTNDEKINGYFALLSEKLFSYEIPHATYEVSEKVTKGLHPVMFQTTNVTTILSLMSAREDEENIHTSIKTRNAYTDRNFAEQANIVKFMLSFGGTSRSVYDDLQFSFSDWLNFTGILKTSFSDYRDEERDVLFFFLIYVTNLLYINRDNDSLSTDIQGLKEMKEEVETWKNKYQIAKETLHETTEKFSDVPSNWKEKISSLEFDKKELTNLITEKNQELHASQTQVEALQEEIEQLKLSLKIEQENIITPKENVDALQKLQKLLESNKILVVGGHNIWRSKFYRMCEGIPHKDNLVLHDIDVNLPKGQYVSNFDHVFLITAYCNHTSFNQLKAMLINKRVHYVNNITNIAMFIDYMNTKINEESTNPLSGQKDVNTK